MEYFSASMWLIYGFGLALFELLTLSFYVLPFSVACFMTSALIHFKVVSSCPEQIIVTAGLGLALLSLRRLIRFNDEPVAQDVGHQITVSSQALSNYPEAVRVFYRGTFWDARFEQPDPKPGVYVITSLQSQTLYLKKF